MKLLDEIIDLLSNDGKLTDALIKTKVLLHEIGHKELVPWVNNELNGYPDLDSVPEYRIVPAQVLANVSNLAYRYASHPIPLGHLDAEKRESLVKSKLDQSLSVLEKFGEKEDGHLQALIPMESYGFLSKGIDSSYNIERAWCEISYTNILQILTKVRSRLLDFILELKDKIPNLDEKEAKEKLDSIDANNLFNNALFGDNTTIVVGANNSAKITNINRKNDFSALGNTLKENGVSQEEINSLQAAIEEDEKTINTEDKEFGPKVKNWLQDMLSKAVDTSWEIELGVASSLLATVLNNYYGWL